MPINISDVANMRLCSQQIAATKFDTAEEIVSWMGAMQAQDYNMVKWAIGLRLADSTEKIIEEAMDKGKILRTHLLRPTWHVVSPEDIHWMLSISAAKIKSAMASRNKQLELTESIFKKSNRIIEKSLEKLGDLTGKEIAEILKKNKIHLDNSRCSHLLLRAELDAI